MFPIQPISKNPATYASHTLRQTHLRRMTLKWSSQTWFVQIAFLAVGAGCVCFGLFVKQGLLLDGIAIALGILFVMIGLLMPFMQESFVFDRDSDSFRRRRWFSSRSEPLADVVGVQLIDSGEHHFPGTNGHTVKVRTFELNLVLKGEPLRRINLLNNPKADSSRSVGSRLAEFLDVPFQDALTNPPSCPTQATPSGDLTLTSGLG